MRAIDHARRLQLRPSVTVARVQKTSLLECGMTSGLRHWEQSHTCSLYPLNSTGESETDRASARLNLIEALVVFVAFQAGIWLFIGAGGAQQKGATIGVST